MVLTIIIDLVLLVLLGLGVFLGVKKGFIMALSKPIKICFSLFLAITLCSVVAAGIIQPIIQESVTGQVAAYISDNSTKMFEDGEVPTLIKMAADLSDVDVSPDNFDDTLTSIVTKLAVPVVHFIAVIIAFVLVYVLSRLILWPTFVMIDKVTSDGLIGKINKTLGCLFGLLVAILVCWFLVCTFDFILGLSFMENREWVLNFKGGLLYRFFSSLSPIAILLSF